MCILSFAEIESIAVKRYPKGESSHGEDTNSAVRFSLMIIYVVCPFRF